MKSFDICCFGTMLLLKIGVFVRKKLELVGDFSSKNEGRPRTLIDFDLRIGGFAYKLVNETKDTAKWRTSLGTNIMALVLTPLLIWFAVFMYNSDLDWSTLNMIVRIAIGFFIFIYLLTIAILFMAIFQRNTLVVDHINEEIRFSGWTNRPYYVLKLSDIRLMSFEVVYSVGSIDYDWTERDATEVLVAELHDGRLASIAFHPSWHMFSFITGWTKADADKSLTENAIDEPLI
ncbi:MAG: hypothetical protein HRU15_04530 [Planctomycetes bacterium]|nr:hypothetical protein [Planctomycetota bacterium]